MKKEPEGTPAGKRTTWWVTNVVIIGTIFAGALLLLIYSDLTARTGIMTKVFIAFLGAIIVVQVMPAMMLLGTMLKGVYGIFKKPKESVAPPRK